MDSKSYPTAEHGLGDEVLPAKARSDLEWGRVLEALRQRCESDVGRDRALKLEPHPRSELATAIAEVREAIYADDHADPLPIAPVPDAREAWQRATHGGVLSPIELRAIADVLAAARTLRRYLA